MKNVSSLFKLCFMLKMPFHVMHSKCAPFEEATSLLGKVRSASQRQLKTFLYEIGVNDYFTTGG